MTQVTFFIGLCGRPWTHVGPPRARRPVARPSAARWRYRRSRATAAGRAAVGHAPPPPPHPPGSRSPTVSSTDGGLSRHVGGVARGLILMTQRAWRRPGGVMRAIKWCTSVRSVPVGQAVTEVCRGRSAGGRRTGSTSSGGQQMSLVVHAEAGARSTEPVTTEPVGRQ